MMQNDGDEMVRRWTELKAELTRLGVGFSDCENWLEPLAQSSLTMNLAGFRGERIVLWRRGEKVATTESVRKAASLFQKHL